MSRVSGGWLEADGTQEVFRLLTEGGFVALAVGGCVRNALLGAPVADVDIATDARPESVMDLAEAAKIKAVPTGIEHGTVTLVVGGTPYEVTTFRKDVETDGRHAVVRFSDDLIEDARRRDFTMNALYARADGTLVDPLGGLPDLRARRVQFIEDAARRIHEDYLRILRFFRFSAWYADPEGGFDPEALAAIAVALDGLEGLSRERVGAEMLRLLAAPDPTRAVATMAQVGVLTRILPGRDARALGPLVMAEGALDLPVDPLRRLAALGGLNAPDLRLSREQMARIDLYQGLIASPMPLSEVAYRHDVDTAFGVLALRSALFEQPLERPDMAELEQAAKASFPVKAQDLMPAFQGPALGAKLRELESMWIASGFTASRADLLDLPGSS